MDGSCRFGIHTEHSKVLFRLEIECPGGEPEMSQRRNQNQEPESVARSEPMKARQKSTSPLPSPSQPNSKPRKEIGSNTVCGKEERSHSKHSKTPSNKHSKNVPPPTKSGTKGSTSQKKAANLHSEQKMPNHHDSCTEGCGVMHYDFGCKEKNIPHGCRSDKKGDMLDPGHSNENNSYSLDMSIQENEKQDLRNECSQQSRHRGKRQENFYSCPGMDLKDNISQEDHQQRSSRSSSSRSSPGYAESTLNNNGSKHGEKSPSRYCSKKDKPSPSKHRASHDLSITRQTVYFSEGKVQSRREVSSPNKHGSETNMNLPILIKTSDKNISPKHSLDDKSNHANRINKMETKRRTSSKDRGLSPYVDGYLEMRRKSDGPSSTHSRIAGRQTTSPEYGHFLGIGLDSVYSRSQRRKSSPAIHILEEKSSSPSSLVQSLNRLAIGSLNASSSDLSENAIRSGHKEIGPLLSSEDLSAEDGSIRLNLLNCPNSSTLQCDCGHINCPCCNLLMNLEVTDPSLLI